MRNRNTSVLRHALTAAVALAVCGANSFAFGDEAARIGREGQAFGKQLSNEFSFPTESGGSFNLGNGTTIGPSDLAPSGDGLYVQDPDVQGVQGIYDSDHDMDVTGRAAQGKLYSDAQAKGNPFDPDPAKRDAPGPSTVSGAAYQVILGVSDARNEIPDLSNDPIISGSGDAMLDDSLLESFGDCSVETEVTETTRPVHMPEEEFCERVVVPKRHTCMVKHDIEIKKDRDHVQESTTTPVIVVGNSYCGGSYNHASIRGSGVINTTVIDLSPYIGDYCAANTSNRSASVSVVSITGSHSYPGGPKPADGSRCHNSLSTENINYSGISCVSGRPQISISSTPNNGVPFRGIKTVINSVQFRINLNYNKTVTNISDRWYPEECVERALKASS